MRDAGRVCWVRRMACDAVTPFPGPTFDGKVPWCADAKTLAGPTILRLTERLPAPGRLRRPFVLTSLRVTSRAEHEPRHSGKVGNP